MLPYAAGTLNAPNPRSASVGPKWCPDASGDTVFESLRIQSSKIDSKNKVHSPEISRSCAYARELVQPNKYIHPFTSTVDSETGFSASGEMRAADGSHGLFRVSHLQGKNEARRKATKAALSFCRVT